MVKVKYAVSSRRRRKRVFKVVKGQFGARSKKLKTAKEALRKGLLYGYAHRKKKKSDFRALWISRISSACKGEGISYSKFIAGLKKAEINLNRKILADLAVNDAKAFNLLVAKVKT